MFQIYYSLSHQKHGNILNGYCHLIACAIVQSAYTTSTRPIYYSVYCQTRFHGAIVKICVKAISFLFDLCAIESRFQKGDKRVARTLGIGVPEEDSNAADVPLHYVIRETISSSGYWMQELEIMLGPRYLALIFLQLSGEVAATLMVLREEMKAAIFIICCVNAFRDVIVQCFIW